MVVRTMTRTTSRARDELIAVRALLWFVWCAICASPSLASASSGPVVVEVEFSAPASCPQRTEFIQRVERASSRVVLAERPGETSRAYTIHVHAIPDGFRGELAQRGELEPRRLVAVHCSELVDVLVAMLVLSAEPVASSAPASAPAPVQHSSERRFESPAAPPPARAGSGPALGGGVVAMFGAAPDTLFGIAIGYEQPLTPALAGRLEARGARARSRANADFVGGVIELCAAFDSELAELRGCSGLSAGYLGVQGVETASNQSDAWLAPRLSLRLRRRLAERSWIEMTGEVEHAMLEREYTIKRDGGQYQTPFLNGSLALLTGMRF